MMQLRGYLVLGEKMGRTLGELLGWGRPMTHREFRTWMAFHSEQWNVPSRGDYYLMAIRHELKMMRGEESVDVNDLKIAFGGEQKKPFIRRMTPEEKLQLHKTMTIGRYAK